MLNPPHAFPKCFISEWTMGQWVMDQWVMGHMSDDPMGLYVILILFILNIK